MGIVGVTGGVALRIGGRLQVIAVIVGESGREAQGVDDCVGQADSIQKLTRISFRLNAY